MRTTGERGNNTQHIRQRPAALVNRKLSRPMPGAIGGAEAHGGATFDRFKTCVVEGSQQLIELAFGLVTLQ